MNCLPKTYPGLKLILSVIALCYCALGLSAQEIAPKAKGALRIMSYNIRNCRGIDNKIDIDRAVQVILDAAPDMVALQEVDSATQRMGGKDMMAELASRTGMYPVFAPSIDYQGGKYGIGMLSREKPVSWERINLPGREEARSLLIVRFRGYYVCCTHMTLTREDQMESVRIITEKLRGLGKRKKIYLAGDFNTRPGSQATAELLKYFDMLSDPDLPTFPSDKPHSAIDYIYKLKGRKQPNVLRYEVMSGRLASDHLPLVVDVKK